MDGSADKVDLWGNTVENDETTVSNVKSAIEKQFITHKFIIYWDVILS